MHITKIQLEDIKSHREAVYEFARGTTAITGENGAGKTTLIEAVAWTLFDLLDYKKDDFVRRGAKKGVVNVTFESGLDGREYRVYRDTGTGYYVYDPQLKTRIADKKDEVHRFLWQHLGVEPGTELKVLFKCAIGVPQGTFTADFLATPAERKPIFDKLLRVEEYRQSSDKLRETANFIKNKLSETEKRIAFSEGKLADYERIETDFKAFSEQADELNKTLEEIEKQVAEKKETVKKFDETEARVIELKTAFEKLQNEKIRADIVLSQKENEKRQAEEAAAKIKAVEAEHKTHTEAQARIKELERERGEREKLNAEMAKTEAAISNVKADQKRFAEDLKKAQDAHAEIEHLKPKIGEQENLEKHLDKLKNELASANAVEKQIASLEKKMKDLRDKFTKNQEQIKTAEEKAKDAGEFENLSKRDAELTQELAKLRAKLESDEKFQNEIKNGLCPILSEKCLNLKPGQTLEGFVSSQFGEVRARISVFENERKTLSVALRNSREAGNSLAQLETLKEVKEEISKEGIGYKSEKEQLEKQLENLPKLKAEINETETKLKTLDDPRARVKHLEKEAAQEIVIRTKITDAESNFERLESERRITVQKLESYKDLDALWAEWTDKRDTTADAHREFLANETQAKLLPEKTAQLKTATEEIEKLKTDLSKAENDFTEAEKTYDREKHISEKANLSDAEKRFAETKANAEHARRRTEELKKELETLRAIRLEMQFEFKEKERLEKVFEATDFIRETLKKSAPLVARNYVYHVSLEANQMFREITGNAERTLKWTEDYGIVLEEFGHERPFVNLSGGEQMAAALSVRLALLKQLSDVRLAFFDEPTTNMDAARRERLAEQISHITERQTFDQLFVISHDDTFEGYVDNVISVGGNADE